MDNDNSPCAVKKVPGKGEKEEDSAVCEESPVSIEQPQLLLQSRREEPAPLMAEERHNISSESSQSPLFSSEGLPSSSEKELGLPSSDATLSSPEEEANLLDQESHDKEGAGKETSTLKSKDAGFCWGELFTNNKVSTVCMCVVHVCVCVCVYVCVCVLGMYMCVCMWLCVMCDPVCLSDTCIVHGPFQAPMRTNSQVKALKTFLPQRNSPRKPETHEVSLLNYNNQPKVFHSLSHTHTFVCRTRRGNYKRSWQRGRKKRRGGRET